jgi:hypothetical protein
MDTVLEKKFTAKDSREDLCSAIIALSSDKNCRLLFSDDNEWKQSKLTEIARLARILKKKL